MKVLSFLFSFLFVAFISTAQDLDKLKSELQEIENQMAELTLSGDWSASYEMYCDDAMSLPSYEPMTIGKSALIQKYEEMKSAGAVLKFLEFKLEILDVIASGNLAITVGTYTMSMEIPQMPNPYKDIGKYINIYEKQDDGSWKLKVETWNSDVNPWMMMQQMMPQNEE